MAYRNGGGHTLDNRRGEARNGAQSHKRSHVADTPTPAKNTPYSLGNRGQKKLEWHQINSATWRLSDPDGPHIETPRCHGHWQGYHTPRALAWVFDVGLNGNHDWRVRVRKRGGWFALGAVADADTAKRLAQAAVDGAPYRNIPPDIPLNLLGGARWPNKRNDRRTIAKVVEAEVGGELLPSADIVPPPDSSECLNVCGADWTDWPPSPDDGGA